MFAPALNIDLDKLKDDGDEAQPEAKTRRRRAKRDKTAKAKKEDKG